MTDEEKKAIDDLKEVVDLYNDKCLITTEDDFKSIEILLNLIEKQSKEIEELKMITKEYDSFLGYEKIIIADKSYFEDGYFKEKFISKDKIKAKIEDILNSENGEAIEKLIQWQSLLEKE